MTHYDHILLIGFGGPEKADDILPFLKNVTKGRNIPDERLQIVSHHYEKIGGLSPYNAWANQLKNKLQDECLKGGIKLPIYLGMRNWHPYLKDTISEVKKNHHQKGIAIILASHKSPPSCYRYKENVKDAQREENAEYIQYSYLPEWHQNPLFIEAQVNQIIKKLNKLSPIEKKKILPIFTAHSIPSESDTACHSCHYSASFIQTCEAIARKLCFSNWAYAYQSRSGNPRQAWLEPDILQKIEECKNDYMGVMIIPVGFLSDNAEVLYDLDIEAKEVCSKNNLAYHRPSTLELEPTFIHMLSEEIQKMILQSKN